MGKVRRWGAVALVVVSGSGVGAAPAPAAEAAPRAAITATRLVDDQGRPLVLPHQINEQGQVLGRIVAEEILPGILTYEHALWHRGEATLIEAPPNPSLPDFGSRLMTMPFEVSELGRIVGMRTFVQSFPVWAFTWERGRYQPLVPETPDDLEPFRIPYWVTDVNLWGEVIGTETEVDPGPPVTGDTDVVVRSATGAEVARLEDQAYPVDLDDRGRALLDVAVDPATGTRRAAVWDRRRPGPATDLGTLGGEESFGLALNVQGHVAGVADTASGDRHAFFWDGGEMVDLGTLGGAASAVGDAPAGLLGYQRAESALNAWGDVVGWAETAGGDEHAVLWRDGTIVDLGTLGGNRSRATAINEWGQVVGWSRTASGYRHAFLWEDGVMTDLGPLVATAADDTPSAAVDINNQGQILGTSGSGAVVWTAPAWRR